MVSTKIRASALAGAVVVVGFWILGLATSIDAPAEIGAASTLIVTFALGWWIPDTDPAPSARDAVKADGGGG